MGEHPGFGVPRLILGLGNDILSDDAIGLRVIDEMQRKFPGESDFKKSTLGGLDILEMIKGYRHVVLIDSIRTGSEPGSVFFLTPEDFGKTLHIANFHDINILNAMEIGRRIGMEMPGRIDIIAIEIVEDKEFSEELSPALEAAFPGICKKVEDWIRLILLRK